MFGPWSNPKKDWLSEQLDGKTIAALIGSAALMFYANHLKGRERRLPASKRSKRPAVFLVLGLGGFAATFGWAYLRHRRAKAEAEAAESHEGAPQQATAQKQQLPRPRDHAGPAAGRLQELLRAMKTETRAPARAARAPAEPGPQQSALPVIGHEDTSGPSFPVAVESSVPAGALPVVDTATDGDTGEDSDMDAQMTAILEQLAPGDRTKLTHVFAVLPPEKAAQIRSRLAGLRRETAVEFLRDLLQRHKVTAAAEAA